MGASWLGAFIHPRLSLCAQRLFVCAQRLFVRARRLFVRARRLFVRARRAQWPLTTRMPKSETFLRKVLRFRPNRAAACI